MLSPLLVIGVGGSGGKTIRSMKQALRRQLDAHRYEGDIPAAWQFLQFDTTYDGLDFPAPMLPRGEFHQVVASGEDFEDVKRKLENLGPLSERQKMLSGWGIPYSPIAIEKGAGQQRAIGRQVGIADAKEILAALSTAISKMRTPTAMAELARMAETLGAPQPSNTPNALIIASLAGGSGAGMFIDIAELLKRATTDTWASESMSILYTSEVFEGLGDAGADVRKNSLGAMNEVVSGKWNGLTERSLMMLDKLGIPSSVADSNDFFGCKGNILVGARNSSGANLAQESSGAGMDEVFLTIGEALAGAFTDGAITEFLYKQAFVNITQRKMTVDASGLAPEIAGKDTLPFAGIGFGRVTLGTDRVVDYVADAMTNKQVEKLLWPELNQELLKDGQRRADLILNKANELWPNFLEDSGLDERGSQDQVLDELRPDNLDQAIKAYITKLVKSGFPERPQESSKVAKSLWSEWESGSGEELDEYRKKTRQKALAWRSMIQQKVANQVAHEVAMNGYFVTIALLEKLEEEVKQYGATSLRREQQDAENAVRGFNAGAWAQKFAELTEGKTGLSVNDSDVMGASAKLLSQVMTYRFNAYLKDLAASLMDDFVTGYLQPLRETLINAQFELDRDWRSEVLPDGQTNPKKWFPEWGNRSVPKKYKPRTIERTLIPAEEYEELFNQYAGRDAADSDPFKKSVGHSLLGLKLDVAPGIKNEQKLISVTSNWVPAVRDAQEMGEPASKATISIETGIVELSQKNRVWLKDPKTSFGALTDMSIRQFVDADGDPEKRAKREDQFVEAYQAMLGLSQPLVKLNRSAMNHIISVNNGEPADGIMLKTSKIPFAIDSRIGRRCTDILQQFGVAISDDGFAGKWFDGASNESMLYSTSTLQASLPAWAFESLTAPIAQQAAISKNNAGLWNQFWDGRRGRPLTESVPFATEIRRSIVTGWFLARLFNMVELEELPVGRSAKIWNPNLTNPGWSQFPRPLISTSVQDNNRNWLLPSILMSGGLALVELGQSGSLEPVHGYQLLKFIGREVTASTQVARDTWDDRGLGDMMPNQRSGRSEFVAKWVSDGEKPFPNVEVSSLLLSDIPSPEARKAAFLSAIEKIQAEYSDAWLEIEKLPWEQVPQTWELKEDINLAFHDIRTYVIGLQTSNAGATSI